MTNNPTSAANKTPARACVIGWPVAHSLSPLIHEYWMKKHGIDGAYDAIAVDIGDLAEFLRGLSRRGLVGANVTIPHKEAVLAMVDELDPVARAIGAVNTVVVQPGGRLRGLNTDGAGFLNWLMEATPEWTAEQGPVLVLGAGGASRAIVAALLGAGVAELRLANRSPGRAKALAKSIASACVTVVPWEDRSKAACGAGLLVNATSLGMAAMPALEIDLTGLSAAAIVYDIVYAPLQTPLLAAARAAGFRTVDGLGMLCHQAALAFEAWFGILPAVDSELRILLEAAINTGGEEAGRDI